VAVTVNHTPSLSGFTTFVRNVVGIPAGYLPDASPVLQHTLDHSLDTVNLDIGVIAPGQRTSWSPYELATYNLAAHLLLEFADDVAYPLSVLSWAAGLVTGVTSVPHTIMPGDQVKLVAVSPLAYAPGAVTVTDVTDNTHFGYRIPRDPGTATLLAGASVQSYYFAKLRKDLKLNTFVPGVVSSTSDLSTSVGLDNPDFFKNLTLDQLQLLKTPYGQRYLAIAQKYGPTVWGLTI
jgi:hypothetical protein